MVKTTLPGGASPRHPRPGTSLTGNPLSTGRLRRCAALAVAGALAVGGLTAGIPALPGEDLMTATAAADTSSFPNVGHGRAFRDSQGTSHWLGANANPSGRDGLLWCIEYGPFPLTSEADMVDWKTVVDADTRSDVDPDLKVTANQMAAILRWYEDTDTDDSRAAISILVHANFDTTSGGKRITDEAIKAFPDAAALAYKYVGEARKGVAEDFTAGQGQGQDASRHGTIHNIKATAEDGSIMSGVDVTVTLDGPAVFDDTGTNTWTGKTGSEPITLAWTATGNGDVPYTLKYKGAKTTMWKYANDGSLQDMLERGRVVDGDPETPPPFKAHFDFQPMATSSVADASSKALKKGATSLSDVIHVKADENYTEGSTKWMVDDKGEYVPVIFEGTAYYTGDQPATPGAVPDGAQAVGTTTVTATGPGDYTATITTDKPLDTQFITWVWQVKKASQGEWASYVAADWSDQYGLADETTSVPEKVEIDSTVQSNVTKSGTYLVDNLYIDGFDDDHGDFEGGAGFGADVDDMTQALYFYPDGLEVTDANLAKATLVAEVTVPAKNGYVDRVGSNKFKMLDGEPEGTYVFVTNFPGDDRTEPYTSSVTDPNEQIRIHKDLKIKTTATDKADGDKILTPDPKQKVTITDKVCPAEGTSLKVGKTYTLTATAMDKNTGEAILNEDGKPYTGTADFTPKTADECGMVDVTIPATALTGKKVVMFEDVKVDGKTVALHTDITDNDQTVDGPNPEIGTTLTDETDGDHKVNAGPVTLTDHVCPKNEDTFTVGATYKVAGTLMDRATGKPVTGKDGAEVTAETTFTPKAADECAIVTFKFDTTDLAGHDVVAFEKAYDADGNLWASHEDINDEGQTVRVDAPPSLPRTGAAVGLLTIAALGLISSGAALVARRRKTDGNDDGDSTGSDTADLEAALA